jgi:arsenite-transporting ATPase
MALKILDRRFLAVIGKGGTGKTTVAAALALLAASRGKRVLVACRRPASA